MAKFSPGDPVWAREDGSGNLLSPGEYPAVIICVLDWLSSDGHLYYQIELPTISLPEWSSWKAYTRENMLRPRRDDYQQHEQLDSMDEVFAPKLDERSLELAREAMKEAEADA